MEKLSFCDLLTQTEFRLVGKENFTFAKRKTHTNRMTRVCRKILVVNPQTHEPIWWEGCRKKYSAKFGGILTERPRPHMAKWLSSQNYNHIRSPQALQASLDKTFTQDFR